MVEHTRPQVHWLRAWHRQELGASYAPEGTFSGTELYKGKQASSCLYRLWCCTALTGWDSLGRRTLASIQGKLFCVQVLLGRGWGSNHNYGGVGGGNRGSTIYILCRMWWQGLGAAGTSVGPVNPQPALIGSPGSSSGLEGTLRIHVLWRVEEAPCCYSEIFPEKEQVTYGSEINSRFSFLSSLGGLPACMYSLSC